MKRVSDPAWTDPDASDLALASLDLAQAPVEPPPGLWAAIEARLAAEPAALASALVAERLTEGRWRQLAPGVRYKRMWSSRTLLLECEPGAVVPDHEHPTYEHALVLSGDLISDLGVFHAGDYHGVPAKGRHSPWTTKTGCRVLVQYAA